MGSLVFGVGGGVRGGGGGAGPQAGQITGSVDSESDDFLTRGHTGRHWPGEGVEGSGFRGVGGW